MRESRIPRPVLSPRPSTSSLATTAERASAAVKRPRSRQPSGDSICSSRGSSSGLPAPTAKLPRSREPEVVVDPRNVALPITTDDEDGFTPVMSKKAARKFKSLNTSPPEARPLVAPVPKPLLSAPAKSAPCTSIPPRRSLPPSVSVASQPLPRSSLPAFRVPQQEGFATSYDAVVALEGDLQGLNARNLVGRDNSSVLVPLDEPSLQALLAVAEDEGARVKILKLDPQTQLTRAVVMGYPLRLPTDLLLRHPQIETAARCQTRKTKDDTRQVLVSVRGSIPASVSLGNWGTFYVRPYTPEPLRCFRCQKYGHHQASCKRQQVCGICSGLHETRLCLERYKAKEAVTHRCPNCSGPHHAWNPLCPARTQRVDRGRERQVEWVQEQQRIASIPAPPGTFVWGKQRQAQVPAPKSLEHFPPLTSAPPEPVLPPPSPAVRAPAAQATPPASQPPLLTLPLLRDLGREIAIGVATAVASALGAKVEAGALAQIADAIVDKCLSRLLPPTAPQPSPLTAPSPSERPEKPKESLPSNLASPLQSPSPRQVLRVMTSLPKRAPPRQTPRAGRASGSASGTV